jgi:hypothetical protein
MENSILLGKLNLTTGSCIQSNVGVAVVSFSLRHRPLSYIYLIYLDKHQHNPMMSTPPSANPLLPPSVVGRRGRNGRQTPCGHPLPPASGDTMDGDLPDRPRRSCTGSLVLPSLLPRAPLPTLASTWTSLTLSSPLTTKAREDDFRKNIDSRLTRSGFDGLRCGRFICSELESAIALAPCSLGYDLSHMT